VDNVPIASGPAFTPDNRINLYYLNELYASIADVVMRRLREGAGIDIPITSGVWGGTYLIADAGGKSLRRIWRLYSIVNLPQNTPLDRRVNLERLIGFYYKAFGEAFAPYGLKLDLKMWGGILPYSNKTKPSITLHMEDASNRVKWLRAFFVWNQATWEESIIHDVSRNLKVLKESLDFNRGPVYKSASETKFMLQDVIITYHTLERALSAEFVEHAEPVIRELERYFLAGLFDSNLIQKLYMRVFDNALIYGFEQALEEPYRQAGLDIHRIEDWPVEKINWVPDALKAKLIPPIQSLFAGFKANLEKTLPCPTAS
jgi:hypothetical protein